MKNNSHKLNFEIVSDRHFKIKINKTIGMDQLSYFAILFEELSLYKIGILDSDITNEWICDLIF